jgi:hypothetical protein
MAYDSQGREDDVGIRGRDIPLLRSCRQAVLGAPRLASQCQIWRPRRLVAGSAPQAAEQGPQGCPVGPGSPAHLLTAPARMHAQANWGSAVQPRWPWMHAGDWTPLDGKRRERAA